MGRLFFAASAGVELVGAEPAPTRCLFFLEMSKISCSLRLEQASVNLQGGKLRPLLKILVLRQ